MDRLELVKKLRDMGACVVIVGDFAVEFGPVPNRLKANPDKAPIVADKSPWYVNPQDDEK